MNEDCTVYKTMNYLSKKWMLLILLELYKGPTETRRYSEIKNSIPDITPKILATRLKELEKEGFVTKKIDTTSFPIKCEYTLTKSGRNFINIIKDIKQWALKWKIKNETCGDQDCKDCGL